MAESQRPRNSGAPSPLTASGTPSISPPPSASTSSIWSPLTSWFGSRPNEAPKPRTSSSSSASLPPSSASVNATSSSLTEGSSTAFKWLSSLASVFVTKEVQGSIYVSFEAYTGGFTLGADNILDKHEFELFNAATELNPLIRERILELLTGENLRPISSMNVDNAETNIAVDEGFVYMSNNGGGMTTEDGDYVLFGHVAFPSTLYQYLLSLGIRPYQIQQALDTHDSNPDKAIEWLLSTKITSSKSTSSHSPLLATIPRFKLILVILTLCCILFKVVKHSTRWYPSLLHRKVPLIFN